MATYKVFRFYQDGHPKRTIRTGLSLAEAQEHCQDPETSSRTATSDEAREHTAEYGEWFDGYDAEPRSAIEARTGRPLEEQF
jgi:hypothetical protein